MIAMDKEDVERSGQFTIVSYYTVLSGAVVEYIPIPHEFFNGTLIGMVDYAAYEAPDGLEFHWVFDELNNQVIVKESIISSYSISLKGLR